MSSSVRVSGNSLFTVSGKRISTLYQSSGHGIPNATAISSTWALYAAISGRLSDTVVSTPIGSEYICISTLPRCRRDDTILRKSSSFSRKTAGIRVFMSSCFEFSDLISTVIFFVGIVTTALPNPVID